MGLLAILSTYLRYLLKWRCYDVNEDIDREIVIIGPEDIPFSSGKPEPEQVAVHTHELASQLRHPLLTTKLLESVVPAGAQELRRHLLTQGLSEEETADVVSEVLVVLVKLRLSRGCVAEMGDIVKYYSHGTNANGELETRKIILPAHVRKPVTEAELIDAETRMQVQLPRFFRRLYTEVGNGGFGPGYGMAKLDDIISGYQDHLSIYNGLLEEESGEEYSNLLWPDGLIYLGTEGCTYHFYLDCHDPHYRVLMFSDSHYRDRLEEGMLLLSDTFDDWIGHWAMPDWDSESFAIKHEVGDVSFPAK